jgi:hypothetical protein
LSQARQLNLRKTIVFVAPVVVFYLTLSAFLLSMSLVVRGFGISQDAYELSVANPLTALAAPFTASLSDSSSNAEFFLAFLLVTIVVLYFDDGLYSRWNFKLFLCAIPVASGILPHPCILFPCTSPG